MKHSKATISKACKLYEGGTPIRQICKKTGIASTSTVLFHCNPEYRQDMNRRTLEWRKKNPRKWKKIQDKAIATHKQKHGQKENNNQKDRQK